MKSFSVRITEPALDNIRDLRAYITKRFHNPEAASLQVERILSAAEALAVFPKIYRVRKTDSRGNALRYFPIDNYMIIYSIDESECIVNILNVFYGKRNIDSLI